MTCEIIEFFKIKYLYKLFILILIFFYIKNILKKWRVKIVFLKRKVRQLDSISKITKRVIK